MGGIASHWVTGHRSPHIPNFFLVGAAKAGTTSLWQYLSSHPEIFMPRDTKEPHYFLWAEEEHHFEFGDWPYIPKRYHTDWQAYLSLFQKATTPVIGEASVHYLPHPSTAEKIKSRCPDARIVISLRNPIDRAWSWYRFNRMRHVESAPTLQDAIAREERHPNQFYSSQYFGLGEYAQQVQRYLHTFGRDRVHIILFDDLVNDPASVCRQLFAFLGVDNSFKADVMRAHNVTVGRHPILDPVFRLKANDGLLGRIAREFHGVMSQNQAYRATKQFLFDRADKFCAVKSREECPESLPDHTRLWLADRYAHDVAQLEHLIGRDLSSWGCFPQKATA